MRLAACLLLASSSLAALYACAPVDSSGWPDEDRSSVKKTFDASAPDSDAATAVDSGAVKGTACDPKVSFAKTIVPELAKLGCGAVTCHGTRFGSAPRIEADDAEITYDKMLELRIEGKAYVNPKATEVEQSAIHCHLRGTCGAKMPPKGAGGTIPEALLESVDHWLACGAPKN